MTITSRRAPFCFLAVCLCAILLFLPPACAEGAGTAETHDFYSGSALSAEDALNGYLNSVFYPRDELVSRSATDNLTVKQMNMYNIIRSGAARIAAGTRTSSIFSFTPSEVLESAVLTASSLGLSRVTDSSGSLSLAAADAVNDVLSPLFRQVINSLLRTCPYDFYWFDFTYSTGGWYWNWSCTLSSDSLTLTELTLKLTVAGEFQDGDRYTASPSIGQTASVAAANARAIVDQYSALSDVEKMRAYKNAVCDLTDYNHDAWSNGQSLLPYGNPWQLLWVFDNDSSTKVVCEGYSKAFHYLCELSDFTGSVSVSSVSGYTVFGSGNPGAHMWNIVSFGNGVNLLVDCTSCDSGSSGHSDDLFLARYVSGSVQDGYAFRRGTSVYTYTYSETATLGIFPTEDLVISGVSDDPPVTIPAQVSLAMGSSVDLDIDPSLSVSAVSDNSRAAVYNSGYIVAYKPGTTVITFTDSSTSATLGTCTVTVTEPDAVDGVISVSTDGYDVAVSDVTAAKRAVIFSFTPSITSYYRFYTSGSADTYGMLFDSVWNELSYSDDEGDGKNFRISTLLTSGKTYYLLVRNYDPLIAFSSSLFLDYLVFSGLEEDGVYQAVVMTGGENLFFSFTPTQSGTYAFISTGGSDTYGYILNSEFETLASDDDSGAGRNFRVIWDMTAGVTYYLRCRFYSTINTGPIQLQAALYAPPAYINALQLELAPGETKCIEYYLTDENFVPAMVQSAVFETVDNDVCTVSSSGEVTAKANGTVTLCVYAEENEGIYTLVGVYVHDTVQYAWTSAVEPDGTLVLTFTGVKNDVDRLTGFYLHSYGDIPFDLTDCVLPGHDGSLNVSVKTWDDAQEFRVYDESTYAPLSADQKVVFYLRPTNMEPLRDTSQIFTFIFYPFNDSFPVFDSMLNFNTTVTFPAMSTPLTAHDFAIPDDTAVIEDEAFAGTPARMVCLPEGLTRIGSRAFADCPNLVGIYIPPSCSSIAADAFSGSDSLVIYCRSGSCAQDYAASGGIPCTVIP